MKKWTRWWNILHEIREFPKIKNITRDMIDQCKYKSNWSTNMFIKKIATMVEINLILHNLITFNRIIWKKPFSNFISQVKLKFPRNPDTWKRKHMWRFYKFNNLCLKQLIHPVQFNWQKKLHIRQLCEIKLYLKLMEALANSCLTETSKNINYG